ncbi:hypothetical protein C0992_004459 [Termitomyces sp. T32_za158]|nr:hypothetical protein C0992_004459 [Termitomyces sp. T32_za158]
MQCDVDGKLPLDEEDDQDSLFGSPPATPVRGRSPSPALALPSASFSTQNVGTIALPGSQHCSELPVTPLALSLNYTLNGHPSALSTTATPSERSTPSSSRASSTGPRPKKRIAKSSKSKESTPRPPPLEISLPDPSGPIPANFLRNQSALLGTAGLVGGIKPSNLSTHRQPPGTAASNPIVIDDDERVPHRPSQASIQPSLEKLGIDPKHLPTPSTQEIMSVLMGQKDTLLVLQSICKLAAEVNRPKTLDSPEPACLTSFRRTPRSFQPSGSANAFTAQFSPTQNASVASDVSTYSNGPPVKKRRLNRVPAGAVDWDVPYPFLEGQGPECYRTNWERERGKQLMSQLVTLVKDAIRKAATRKYLQNDLERKRVLELHRTLAQTMASKVPEEPKVHGHYRPSTITYGLQGEAAAAARAQVQKVLTDASNSIKSSTVASLPTTMINQSAQASDSRMSTPQPSVPFDQLISSILAATPPSPNLFVDCGASLSSDIDGNAGAQTGSSMPISSVPPQNLDQGPLDNLVNIFFQNFPTSAQDFVSPNHNASGPLSQPNSSRCTPTSTGLGLSSLNSTLADMIPVDSRRYDLDVESATSTPAPSSHVTQQPQCSFQEDREPGVPEQECIIDPALLAISVPTAPVASTLPVSLEPLPSLRSSPIPSLSSFGDVDPPTPNSVAWDASIPEVFASSGADAFNTENGLVGSGCRAGGLTDQGMWSFALETMFPRAYDFWQCVAEENLNGLIEARSADKGKSKATDDFQAQASPLPILVQSHSRCHSTASSSPSLQTSSGQRPLNKLQASRADTLKRAAKRKNQLVKAIASIRTQLWETTIEQGVLLHMNKLCTHAA